MTHWALGTEHSANGRLGVDVVFYSQRGTKKGPFSCYSNLGLNCDAAGRRPGDHVWCGTRLKGRLIFVTRLRNTLPHNQVREVVHGDGGVELAPTSSCNEMSNYIRSLWYNHTFLPFLDIQL